MGPSSGCAIASERRHHCGVVEQGETICEPPVTKECPRHHGAESHTSTCFSTDLSSRSLQRVAPSPKNPCNSTCRAMMATSIEWTATSALTCGEEEVQASKEEHTERLRVKPRETVGWQDSQGQRGQPSSMRPTLHCEPPCRSAPGFHERELVNDATMLPHTAGWRFCTIFKQSAQLLQNAAPRNRTVLRKPNPPCLKGREAIVCANAGVLCSPRCRIFRQQTTSDGHVQMHAPLCDQVPLSTLPAGPESREYRRTTQRVSQSSKPKF